MKKQTSPSNYKQILEQIKHNISHSQVKAGLAANKEMLWLYWQIGNEILEQQKNQGWGTKVIDRLSKDICKEFPKLKGFSQRNILYMKQFASVFTPQVISVFAKAHKRFLSPEFIEAPLLLLENIEYEIDIISQPPVAKLQTTENETITISQPPVAKLQSNENKPITISQPLVAKLLEADFAQSPISKITWSHHIVLINKVKEYKKIFWYVLNTIEHGISRDVLALQIESKLFERQIKQKKITNFKNTLPAPQSDFANYLLKDPYIFDFIQAKEKADERDIEQQLVKHITKFLLELGQGFAFVGEQYHLKVGDSDFYIDLLFYHTKLHCYVVVELKAGAFTPEDAGQIGFYIAAVDGEVATSGDNPTLGLLLCKHKNQLIAEYALKGNRSPIGVAEYELSRAVPENLKSQLPSIEEIENEFENLKI